MWLPRTWKGAIVSQARLPPYLTVTSLSFNSDAWPVAAMLHSVTLSLFQVSLGAAHKLIFRKLRSYHVTPTLQKASVTHHCLLNLSTCSFCSFLGSQK